MQYKLKSLFVPAVMYKANLVCHHGNMERLMNTLTNALKSKSMPLD